MSEERPRVVAATFHNYRRVMNRKVLQIVFEVDLDREMETLETLGTPNYAEPNWYAIARLKEKPGVHRESMTQGDEALQTIEQSTKPKERRQFHTLPLASQCAIRCEDVNFQNFARARYGVESPALVAEFVRQHLGVKSRSELGRGNHAADNKWRRLSAEYDQWLTDQQYAGSVR